MIILRDKICALSVFWILLRKSSCIEYTFLIILLNFVMKFNFYSVHFPHLLHPTIRLYVIPNLTLLLPQCVGMDIWSGGGDALSTYFYEGINVIYVS